MPKEKIYHPASDCFSSAWEGCFALWPVFLIQLAFLVLQYAALFFLIFLLAGPFLEKCGPEIEEGLQMPNAYDWSGVESLAASYFLNLDWILLALGAGTLYMLWWSLLSAFSNGGIYRAFWENRADGTPFSWPEFFKNGASFLFRFLYLQTLLMIVTLILFMGLVLFTSLGGFLVGFVFTRSILMGIFLIVAAIPVGLTLLCLMMAFWAYVFLWMADLTRAQEHERGPGVSLRAAWNSMWEAGRRFRENRWRIGIGLTVACLVYVVASFLTRFVLGHLGHLPVIGILFDLLDLVTALAFVVLFLTYMPALSVTYLLEKEM